MRLIAVFILAFSFIAGSASAFMPGPPECGDNCPWVR